MLINVRDADFNSLLNACFFGLVLVAIASCIPGPRRRWTLWLPVLAIGIYVVCEWAMPVRYDIRLDLVLIMPLVLITIGACLVRLVLRRRSGSS